MQVTAAPSVRIIVVANEKGWTGKSTVAIHLEVALLKSGQNVATIDLDCRQHSLTHYIDNRLAWSQKSGYPLAAPTHVCFDEEDDLSVTDISTVRASLIKTAADLSENHAVIVIDTPCQNRYLTRAAHQLADTLITPMNDSFVDLDVLANVDPESFRIARLSHYSAIVEEARRWRQRTAKPNTEWIVLRNRLSHIPSRNKRFVGEALEELSKRLGFRCVEGFGERVVFREYYPRGLTAADDLNAAILGTRPTMSHAAAQLEVQGLIAALLTIPEPSGARIGGAEAAQHIAR